MRRDRAIATGMHRMSFPVPVVGVHRVRFAASGQLEMAAAAVEVEDIDPPIADGG
jgi:hypothetical protein